MDQALAQAQQGVGQTAPNPPVGAVVVQEGRVIGQGYHPGAGQPHAEIFALRQAQEAARGATLYVTLEPCSHYGRTPPCCQAIIEAGLARVVMGCRDPNPQVAGRGIAQLQAAGIEVVVGVREETCQHLIAGFAKHIQSGLPRVTYKGALTLDGQTATASGESQWISSPESRSRAHSLRAAADGIIVGIGTVLADNPRLTTRLQEGPQRDAQLVVVDSRLRIPLDAALLEPRRGANAIIVTAEDPASEKAQALRHQGAFVWQLACPQGIDLKALLMELGRCQYQNLLLEGGAQLAHSFLHAGLVDALHFFVAPCLLGGQGTGIFQGAAVSQLQQAYRLKQVQWQPSGPDLEVTAEVAPCSPA